MKSVLSKKTLEPKSIILIIDRVGFFGEKLSAELSKDYFVILVSNRQIQNKHKNITQLKYSKKVPKIPRNNYSKIFLVDDGRKVTKDVFSSISKESRDYDSELFLLTSLRNPNTKNSDYIIKSNKRAKLLIFGDVFDNNYYFENTSSVTQFIKGVRKNKKIVVKNDGLSDSYPISLEDTLKLIIKAAFIKVPQKIILLFYITPITDMTLSHMFQKLDPEIDVDFKDTEEIDKVYFPKDSTHAIKNYDVLKRLKALDLNKEAVDASMPIKEGGSGLGIIKYLIFFIALMGFVFLLPLLTTFSYVKIGYYQIEKSHDEAKKGEYIKATEKAKSANELFSFAKESNEVLEKQLELIEIDNLNNDIEKDIVNGEMLSGAMMRFYDGMVLFEDISTTEGLDTNEVFNKGMESLKTSYSLFQKINFDESLGGSLGKEIIGAYPFIERVVNISEVLPSVFGADGKKQYLVLFQDNTEARPGGGVVRALGIATFDNYELINFDVRSVDEININEVSLSPSYIAKRYLKENKPTIKNSGLNIDSATNAVNASTIYGLSEGVEVDGVVISNGEFLLTLLESFGPVAVDDFGSISTNNFYDELSLSSNKDIFYKNVVIALSEKIADSPSSPYYSFFQALGKSVTEKNILFAFRDSEIQNVILSNSMSGSIVEVDKDTSALYDFFGIYETNIGGESTSRFVSRSVTKINSITSDGAFISELSISFKNNTPNSVLGPKNYESYVQLVLPLGSSIDEVSVGGQRKKIIPAITDESIFNETPFQIEDFELRQGVEGGKAIYGFFIDVQSDATKIVKINYSLPFSVSARETPTSYELKIYKQPGVESYPFNLLFKSNFFLVLPEDSYSGEISKDVILNFLISRK